MKVTILRGTKGVTLKVIKDLEAEVEFKDGIELGVFEGMNVHDDEALAGKRSFQRLSLISTPICDSETAEKAVEELLELKKKLELLESVKVSKINALAGFFAKVLKEEEGFEVEVKG